MQPSVEGGVMELYNGPGVVVRVFADWRRWRLGAWRSKLRPGGSVILAAGPWCLVWIRKIRVRVPRR